jgi:hypothetical protein
LEQRIANAAFGVIGLVCAYGCLVSAGIPRLWRILTAILIALALGFPRHKTYEQALSLVAVAATMFVLIRPASAVRWITLGLASGLAAFIGRNSGLFFLITGLFVLLWEGKDSLRSTSIRRTAAYGLGVIVGYMPMLWLITADLKFRDAFIESIRFTKTFQMPLPIPFPWRQATNLSSVPGIQQAAVSWLCVAVFAIYALAAFRCAQRWWRGTRIDDPVAKLEIAALFSGIPYLYQGFIRADFGHIAQGIMPVFLLVTAQCFSKNRRFFIAQYVVMSVLAYASWIPSEPRVQAHILYKNDPKALTYFDIAGQNYLIDSVQASLMSTVKHEFERCTPRDGGFLEAPHYPGLYAYLHTRAPIWELYFLYQRPVEFQSEEIKSIKKWRPSIVLLNEKATVDGKQSLLLKNTNSSILSYVHAHYSVLDTRSLPGEFQIYEVGCGDVVSK